MAELLHYLNSSVLIGLLQALGAVVLCAVVVSLCRWNSIHVEREAVISIARGFVQMVLVGIILALLLSGNLLIGSTILLLMMITATLTAARRARGMSRPKLVSFAAIAAGSGITIIAMVATGAVQTKIAMLVPIGSMIIANAMNACAQATERFRSDVRTHVGHIEAALALGADPAVTVAPYVQSAVYASLLPRLDMLKSLGLVWIPGVMAGMVVSGTSPVSASIYQFVLVAMILTASGITGLVVTLLMRTRAFSPAAQLLIRQAQSP